MFVSVMQRLSHELFDATPNPAGLPVTVRFSPMGAGRPSRPEPGPPAVSPARPKAGSRNRPQTDHTLLSVFVKRRAAVPAVASARILSGFRHPL